MAVMVTAILLILALYLVAGILFAILFLIKGIEKTDPAAHGSGWGFKLIILPGTIVFWPVLLHKWIQSKHMQHDKATA